MIKEAILKVYKHEDLTYEEAYETMDEIMSGKASEVQMSAYLTRKSWKLLELVGTVQIHLIFPLPLPL